MSLTKMYDAVLDSASRIAQQKESQDLLNVAAATLQMSQAYGIMKDLDLHEQYHRNPAPGGQVLLPGEEPIEPGGLN